MRMGRKKKRVGNNPIIPRALKIRYEQDHGREFVAELARVSASSVSKPLYLRVNTLKCSEQCLMERFDQENILVKRVNFLRHVWEVKRGQEKVKRIPEYFAGYHHVQDLSSLVAIHVLDLRPGLTVLDACAAPGGKTTHMSQLMRNEGIVMANEHSISRVRQLQSVVNRLGAANVVITNQDATEFDFSKILRFDRILIDAPCSSDGVAWRRGFWSLVLRNYRQLDQIVRVQWQMLNNCWQCLENEGILLYATCSFSLEENERLISRFLTSRTDVRLLDLSNAGLGQPAWADHDGIDSEVRKARRFTPMHDQANGFFLAKLQKIESH